MAQSPRLANEQMALRVLREFQPGQTIALGSGLPGTLCRVAAPDSGLIFLAESGVLGYQFSSEGVNGSPGVFDSGGLPVSLLPGSSISSVDETAAMLRGGHVDIAVVQPAQVDAQGSFTHWTSAATPGLHAPGASLDLAVGPRRLVAMMHHTSADGGPNIAGECRSAVDGVACVNLIVTDLAVIAVSPDSGVSGNSDEFGQGLVLTEVAPGWRADDLVALTGAQLRVSPNLTSMRFDLINEPVNGAAAEKAPDKIPVKVYESGPLAVGDIPNGATIMIDGFAGPGGMAHYLLVSLRDQGAKDLTIISNTAGIARVINFGTPPGRLAIDHSILVENNQVRKAIASYPVSPSVSRPSAFELAYRKGEVELELVPQGTLAERLRAGAAGIGGFYTPTGVGTQIAEGKETRTIEGKEYLLETGLRADYCLIRGFKADTLGNVVYKGTSRNFNSVMAPAAAITIVEVDEIVAPGGLDPELIVTPGIYVSRVVKRPADFSPYE